MSNKINYQAPEFITVSNEEYNKWLQRKAESLKRRDKKKKINSNIKISEYKNAIHKAVIVSKGEDIYTKEKLSWDLIGKYKDIKIPLLPTIDHVNGLKEGDLNFAICSWKTNDCKNDLSVAEFIEFCKLFIKNNEIN